MHDNINITNSLGLYNLQLSKYISTRVQIFIAMFQKVWDGA